MRYENKLCPVSFYFDYMDGDDLRSFVQTVRDYRQNYFLHLSVDDNEVLALHCVPKRF